MSHGKVCAAAATTGRKFQSLGTLVLVLYFKLERSLLSLGCWLVAAFQAKPAKPGQAFIA